VTPRLASSVLVGALVRKAQAEGGFAAVIAKGDANAGSILLILLEKGAKSRALERLLRADGTYGWAPSTAEVSDKAGVVPDLIARRRRSDPDLWVLELDVPSAERFAAEMSAFD
jgi:hypothetical protein